MTNKGSLWPAELKINSFPLLYEKAFISASGQVDDDDQYDIACLYALTGDVDRAFKYLQALVDANFKDYEYLTKDDDLNAIHEDDRWKDFLSLIQQNQN